MSKSSISVIVPTYNRAHLLGRAIASVLMQLEDGDELIVVDDGSTDRTEEMIAPYGDRIRYILTDNQGAGAARNRGVSEARNGLAANSELSHAPDKFRQLARSTNATGVE